MKLRLPYIMLLALLTGGAYQAQAGREFSGSSVEMLPGKVNEVKQDITLTIDPSTDGMNQTYYRPYVKDGDGTATVIADGTMNAALYVREGKMVIGNGAENDKVTVTLNPADASKTTIVPPINEYQAMGASTSLSIGGKNASLELNHAEVKTAMASSMVVGSTDGSGKLTVTNGSFLNNYIPGAIGLYIGAASGTNSKTVTNHYNAHVHGTKDAASPDKLNAVSYGLLGLKPEYKDGTYDALSDGTQVGAGTVEVSNGSRLYAGYNGIVMGQGALTIKNDSHVYAGYDNGSLDENGFPKTPSGQEDKFESSFGALAKGTSTVLIEQNSSLNMGVGLKLGATDGSVVNMTVGEGSLLNVQERAGGSSPKTYMGVAFEMVENSTGLEALKITIKHYDPTWNITGGADSTVNLNVEKGGTVSMQEVYMGHADGKSDVTVEVKDRQSTFKASSLEMQAGTKLSNKGNLIVANTLTIAGGTLVNEGVLTSSLPNASKSAIATLATDEDTLIITATGEVVNDGIIDKNIEMSGGSLTALGGSTMAAVFSTGGVITIDGMVSMTGALTLNGGQIIFNDGSGIDMGGNLVSISDLTSITVYDSDGSFVLFENVDEAAAAALVGKEIEYISHGSKRIGIISAGDNGTSIQVLPEPTTATLSLLALTALAARRRRR